MISSSETSARLTDERVYLKLHDHQSLESKCIGRTSPYRTVVSIGGVGSGKTLTVARWMIDRGKWDTSQFHALFASTGPQLQQAILGEALPWLEMAGIDSVWNRRPPSEWIEGWRRAGIKTPSRLKKYTNILILSTGMHIYCGSMSNRSYRQVKGMQFGSVLIEEVCHGASEEGVRFIFERVRCGMTRAKCIQLHRHIRILHGNPPDDDGHFIYNWLSKWEAQAARKAGMPERTTDDSYPCLLRGLGDVIYIPSRTRDNEEHLGDGYIDDIANTVDDETAKRVLDGVLTRSRKGRVYNGFDRENEWDVPYDPTRTLWIALDFNVNPAVALFAHPLKPGEFPGEFDRDDISHAGVFGEFFHVGGMDVSGLCGALLMGDRGSHGHLPGNWKGVLEHGAKVVFFGDATSGYARMAGNEWQAVDDIIGKAIIGRYARNVPDKNPLVALGVRAVNAKFCSASRIRSLFIHPRCAELVTDLLTVVWDKTGKDVQKYGYRPGSGSTLWQRGHLSDALRYLIARQFPMGHEVTPTAPKLAPRSTIRMPRIR